MTIYNPNRENALSKMGENLSSSSQTLQQNLSKSGYYGQIMKTKHTNPKNFKFRGNPPKYEDEAISKGKSSILSKARQWNSTCFFIVIEKSSQSIFTQQKLDEIKQNFSLLNCLFDDTIKIPESKVKILKVSYPPDDNPKNCSALLRAILSLIQIKEISEDFQGRFTFPGTRPY